MSLATFEWLDWQ